MASFIISEVQIFTGNEIIPRRAVLVEDDFIAKIILHNDACQSACQSASQSYRDQATRFFQV
jgi:hypothetical protein